MTASVKYHAKRSLLFYGAGAGTAPATDLSGSSREIQINQSGSDIDVSTRDDIVANSTAYLAGPPQRDVQISGLDTETTRPWHAITVGDAGRVAVYPYGSAPSGYPYEIGDVICTSSSYSSPHDNAAKWDIKWRVNGVWTAGTT